MPSDLLRSRFRPSFISLRCIKKKKTPAGSAWLMVNGLCYKLLYFSNNLTVHIYVYTIAGVEPHILLLFILERRGGQGEKNIQRCEARAVCSLTCSSHSKFICSFSLFFLAGEGLFPTSRFYFTWSVFDFFFLVFPFAYCSKMFQTWFDFFF